MDEGEDQKHRQAIQSFREFTGNQDDSTARRLLSMYNWDVQRAINIFFMRGAPLPEQQQKSDDSDDEDIIVDGDDEIRAVQPSFEPKRRISHFVKKNKNIEKIQTTENKEEDKKDDSEDNIRAPIPAVKGVMLAQSYRQTYENGNVRPGTSHSIFEQYRNLEPNDKSSETVEKVMEESAATSSSSIQEKYKQKGGFSPPTNSFKKIKLHHRTLEVENGKQHDNNKEKLIVSNDRTKEESSTTATTGGFGQGLKKRKDLRLLFRPPTDLIFYGDWDKALQTAKQSHRWLLVNVQNSLEFACAVLNRDIWSAETVKDVVRSNFIFWQVYLLRIFFLKFKFF
uniref:Uncharacterized protein n=1 Tax=Meloidogyne incognita TaxID=6306 RepID=A0A914LGU0_MELIC